MIVAAIVLFNRPRDVSSQLRRVPIYDYTWIKRGGIRGFNLSNPLEYTGTIKVDGVINSRRQVIAITDTTFATEEQSGALFYARPITGKIPFFLPAASAGLEYEVFVADADSLIVFAATGDSLITSAGAAYVCTGSVAGTVKFVALDSVRWLMNNTIGTWRSK